MADMEAAAARSRPLLASFKTCFWFVVAVEWLVVSAALLVAGAVVLPRGNALGRPALRILDALEPLVCPAPRTVYSAGFNEEAFQSVRPGMTEPQVLTTLGEPLMRSPNHDGTITWVFSWPDAGAAAHHNRVVIFGAERRVAETHASCED
jgi:hypothetical protein